MMNLQENIPAQIKRRIHLIDRVIDNLLPNMYPCDYNSSDHFVEGVLDEIFYFIKDEPGFYGIDIISINDFILDYKYDELTNYFNERCIILKNYNLQESIRRILREEGYIPSPIKRRVSSDDIEEAFDHALERMGRSMNNPNSIIYIEKGTTLRTFAKFVIDEMVTYIEQDYFNDNNRIYFSDNDEDYESYHEKIRQPLLKFYGNRIKEKYNKVKTENINESTLRETKEEKISNFIGHQFDKVFNKLRLEIEYDERWDTTLYGRWYDENNDVIFHRNDWGSLFVEDCVTYKKLRRISKGVNLDVYSFNEVLLKFLNNKYMNKFDNKPLKNVNTTYSGECLGGEE